MKVETLNLIGKRKKLFCSLIFTWLISGDVDSTVGWGGGGVLLAPFKDKTDENWYPILGQNLKNETQFKGKTKPKNLMETLLKSLS